MTERLLRYNRVFLALADVLAVILAFFLAWYVRYELEWYRAVDPAFYTGFGFYFKVSLLTAALIVFAYYLEGIYRLPRGTSFLNEFYRLLNATTTVTIILMVANYILQPPYHSRFVYLIAGFLILVLAAFNRLVYRQVMKSLRRRGYGARRILLVGAGEVSRAIMRALLARPELGYEVLGFLDDNPAKGQRDLGPFHALGGIDNLPQSLVENQVDEVIITLPWQYHRRIMSVLSHCERQNVRARIVPDVLQLSLDRVDVEILDGIPLLGTKSTTMSRPQFVLKRLVDVTITLLAMIIALPLMGIIALAIKLDSPGPAIFVQERVGRNGVIFKTYKFRSMVSEAEALRPALAELNEADGPLFKIRDDPRMTRVGRILRRFSLDELPQMFNVLRGDMSVVGPRPALPEEVAAYEPWHRKRLEVLPGITGLWQVSGRSNLSFDEMVLLDIYYVENWSLSLDISIILRTLPKVLMGEGAY
ncbi:MAG: sugar transferase [Caldilineae bacterium]|nr:MAG: sugar transferase [Caldilineae bacterium]